MTATALKTGDRVRVKNSAQTVRWVALQERWSQHPMAGCTGTVGRVFEQGAVEVTFAGWPGDDDVWTIYSDDLEVVE